MGLAPFLNRAILAIAVGLTNALFDYHIAVEFKIITPILIMGLKKYYYKKFPVEPIATCLLYNI